MNPHNKDDADEVSNSSRRTFCKELMLTAGLVVAGSNVTTITAAQDSMIVYPPRKIDGADMLLPGGSLYFNYPTRSDPAVLLRSCEGECRAYSRRCSHAGCSVDFDASSRCLKCPCHHGAFDGRMGHVMFGPPRRPLDEIVLQVRAGGHVWAVGKGIRGNPEITAQVLGGGE